MTSDAKIFIHKDGYLYWFSEAYVELLKLSIEQFIILEPSYNLPLEYEEFLGQKVTGLIYNSLLENLCIFLSDGTATTYTTSWGRGQKLLEKYLHYQLTSLNPVDNSFESVRNSLLVTVGEIAESKYKILIDGRETEATFLWGEKYKAAKSFLETGDMEQQFLKIEAMSIAELTSDDSEDDVYKATVSLATTIVNRYNILQTNSALIAANRTNKRKEISLATTLDELYSIDISAGWPV